MLKLSINRALWVFGFVQMATILGYAWLSMVGRNLTGLFAMVSAEYVGLGMGAIALTAFIARETSRGFTATQFALFSSLFAIPRVMANASTGFIIEAIGYTQFYVLCTLLAVPGMLLSGCPLAKRATVTVTKGSLAFWSASPMMNVSLNF